jgi:hypothetical protein
MWVGADVGVLNAKVVEQGRGWESTGLNEVD